MKALLSICLLLVSSSVFATEMPGDAPAGVVKGVVLEVKNVANFTYLRLKTGEGETWAAVVNTPVKKGASITIDDAVVMKDFVSKGMNRTFSSIVFGSLRGAGAKAASGTEGGGPAMGETTTGGSAASGTVMGTAYPILPARKLETINEAPVPKAEGPNAFTVAEIVQQAAALKDKPVVVRGRVVKYNPEIMGKNWVHLRDGSGSAADESNDILVATTSKTKVGAVVTAKGVLHTDKDLGMGYTYKALIEEATLQQ